jgi:predicted nucleic acid-binding protein
LTSIGDTRLLIELEFPSKEENGLKIRDLIEKEIEKKLLIPSIVIAEFIEIAGAEIGVDAAKTRIRIIKEKGAKTVAIDEETAIVAGCLRLNNRNVPIADALIASFVKNGVAQYVITDDPHFKTLNVKTKWV